MNRYDINYQRRRKRKPHSSKNNEGRNIVDMNIAYIGDSKSCLMLVNKHKINLYKLDMARSPGVLITNRKRMSSRSIG